MAKVSWQTAYVGRRYAIGFLVTICFQCSASHRVTNDPVMLLTYKSYASCILLEYDVPESTAVLGWSFTLVSPEGCPARRAFVYVEHGGYPVINYLNETFPPHFRSNPSELMISLSTDENHFNSQIFYLYTPQEGKWFAAAFLDNDHVDEAAVSKISKEECTYGLKTIQKVFETTLDVHDIGNLQQRLHLKGNASTLLRVYVPAHAYELRLQVDECSVIIRQSNGSRPAQDKATSEPCSLMLAAYKDGRLPLSADYPSEKSAVCKSVDDCSLTVFSPQVDGWYHILVQNLVDADCSIALQISSKRCSEQKDEATACTVNQLSRANDPAVLSTSDFVQRDMAYANASSTRSYLAFKLMSPNDNGGTLRISAFLPSGVQRTANLSDAVLGVLVCLRWGALPIAAVADDSNGSVNAAQGIPTAGKTSSCLGPNAYEMRISANQSGLVNMYVPYPRSGWWYLGHWTLSDTLECASADFSKYNNNGTLYDQSVKQFPLSAGLHGDCMLPVRLSAHIRPCVDGSCSASGTCQEHVRGALHFTTCSCSGGWRGYGCTDDTLAVPFNLQLLHKVLLMLSNLGFLVVACFAIRWRWFSEATVYVFTAISSTLYHACDGSNMFNHCVLLYKNLQVMDFVGSSCCLWVTLLAIAKIHPTARAAFQIGGVLTLTGTTMHSPTSAWNVALPLAVGALICMASMVRQCKVHHRCYPSKRVWLIQFLPGLLLAIAGLVLYVIVVDPLHNYAYVHSTWHVVAAVTVASLLPREWQLKCSLIWRSALMRRIFKRHNSHVAISTKEGSSLVDSHAMDHLSQPAGGSDRSAGEVTSSENVTIDVDSPRVSQNTVTHEDKKDYVAANNTPV